MEVMSFLTKEVWRDRNETVEGLESSVREELRETGYPHSPKESSLDFVEG